MDDATLLARELVPVDDGELPVTVVRSNAVGAAVIIVPSLFGVGADLEAQMREIAAASCLVVAIDPFFRSDPGPVEHGDRTRVMARMQALKPERIYLDLRAATEWTRAQRGVESLVMLGICMGGSFALFAAADGLVDGVVTWHGTRMEKYLARAAEMRCPMRFHCGAVDPIVPPAAVDALRAAFAGRRDVQIVVHEGATHGFSHRAAPEAYDARAERAGMDAVRELVSVLHG